MWIPQYTRMISKDQHWNRYLKDDTRLTLEQTRNASTRTAAGAGGCMYNIKSGSNWRGFVKALGDPAIPQTEGLVIWGYLSPYDYASLRKRFRIFRFYLKTSATGCSRGVITRFWSCQVLVRPTWEFVSLPGKNSRQISGWWSDTKSCRETIQSCTLETDHILYISMCTTIKQIYQVMTNYGVDIVILISFLSGGWYIQRTGCI